MSENAQARGEKPGREKARERVRCSSLVDWPVYPRLRGTMQASTRPRKWDKLDALAAARSRPWWRRLVAIIEA
jgi:hypothetical protein